MIVGTPEEFAMEFWLDDEPCGEWLYGFCRFWCSGKKIGNDEVLISLRELFWAFEEMAWAVGLRHNPVFFEMPDAEALRMLSSGLFGVPQLSQAQNDRLLEKSFSEQWGRYCVLPLELTFQDWTMYYFENDESGKFVWSRMPLEIVDVAMVPLETLDRVFLESFNLLETLYNSSRVSNGPAAISS